jgi:carbonic anhydrase
MGKEVLYVPEGYLSEVGCQKRQQVKYLAVYCSDPFYHQAFEEFLSKLGEAFIAFAEPGGPLLAVMDWNKPVNQNSILGRMSHLIQELGVEEVVFISHSKCAAYSAAYSEAGLSQEEIDAMAMVDLQNLKCDFPKRFPEIKKVYTFFAFENGEHVRFIRT